MTARAGTEVQDDDETEYGVRGRAAVSGGGSRQMCGIQKAVYEEERWLEVEKESQIR